LVTHADSSKQWSVELSTQQQAQIKEIFELFDTDGGGTIDTHELSAAMFALGFQSRKPMNSTWKPSVSSTNEMLERDISLSSRADSSKSFGDSYRRRVSSGALDELLAATTGSGEPRSIDLEEFTALMKGELLGQDPQEEIRSTFAAFSMSHQGNIGSGRNEGSEYNFLMLPITLDMLRSTCKEFDVLLTEKELVSMIEEVDTDGNGFVEETEYVSIMSLSPWF
jgi:Ca2+-binding EF-hand superfamily protein